MYNSLIGKFGGFAGSGAGFKYVRFLLIGQAGTNGTTSGGDGGATVYTINTETFNSPQSYLFRKLSGGAAPGPGGQPGGAGYFMSTATVTPATPYPVPAFRPTIIAAVGGGGGGIYAPTPSLSPANVGGAGGGNTGADGVGVPPAPAGKGGTQTAGGNKGSGGGSGGTAGQFLIAGVGGYDPNPGGGGGGGGAGYYGGGGGGGGASHHSAGGGGSGHANTVYTYYHTGATTQGDAPSYPGLSHGIYIAAGNLQQMNQPYPTTTLSYSPLDATTSDKFVTINKDGTFTIGTVPPLSTNPHSFTFMSGPLTGTHIDLGPGAAHEFTLGTEFEFISGSPAPFTVDVVLVGGGGGGGGGGRGVDSGPANSGGAGGSGGPSFISGPNITTVVAGGGQGGNGGGGTDFVGGNGGNGVGGTASGGDTNVNGNSGSGGAGYPDAPGGSGGNAPTVWPGAPPNLGQAQGGNEGEGSANTPSSPPNGGNGGGGGGGAGGGAYAAKQFTILVNQTYTVRGGTAQGGGSGAGSGGTGGPASPGIARITKT